MDLVPMLRSRSSLALLLALAAAASASGARADRGVVFLIDEVRLRTADDPAFADPAHDDSDWQALPFERIPQIDRVHWVRARVRVGPDWRAAGHPLGVLIGAMASHEIFWDGVRLGAGGVVGETPEAETPGPIERQYAVPDPLAEPGEHLIALRMSAHHRGWVPAYGYWYLLVGDYDRLLANQSRSAGIALVGLSGIAMMAVFAFALWVSDRRDRASLLLALLSVAAAALLLAEAWRPLFNYTYDWQIVRLRLVTGLAWLLDLGLLAFLAVRFPMTARAWLLGLGMLGATIPIFIFQAWDPRALTGFMVVFALALAWALRAVWQCLPGSRLAAAGLAICVVALAWRPGLFIDRNLYLALDALFAFLLVGHARQLQRSRRDREEARVRSARLEVELLKRQLQPHFMMNTLTALAEWLEEDPATAARMIQALSDELRLLAEISDRGTIPLADELRLCRGHLELMALRTGTRHRLEVTGGIEGLWVPPAVFHTLVENAVTHHGAAAAAGAELALRLTVERRDGRIRYTFEAPYAGADPDTAPGEPTGDGTGLRYVRARLRESFGSRWALEHGPRDARWISVIEVPATSGAATSGATTGSGA